MAAATDLTYTVMQWTLTYTVTGIQWVPGSWNNFDCYVTTLTSDVLL